MRIRHGGLINSTRFAEELFGEEMPAHEDDTALFMVTAKYDDAVTTGLNMKAGDAERGQDRQRLILRQHPGG